MSTKIYALLLIISCIATGFGQPVTANTEPKVDYLERIYFSGETKAGLNTNILIALQELEGKTPTPALAKQLTFLIEIKDKANEVENACDVLDMLAAGIYNIDAAEAMKQGVRPPSDKAKTNTGDAIASLSKLNSTANSLSGSAYTLGWSSYLLSGGKTGSFLAGASKVGGAANTLGNVAGAAGKAAQTGKQLSDLGKAVFKKKDKPCNDVAKKDIEIGEHAASIQISTASAGNATHAQSTPAASTGTTPGLTVISVSQADYTKLSTIHERLKKNCATVSETKMKFDTNGSLINVSHSGTVEDLLAVLLSACKDMLSPKNVVGMNPDERKIDLKLQQ